MLTEEDFGSFWVHHSGRIYEVYDLTNPADTGRFPLSVSFRNIKTQERFSRPVKEFVEKFIRIEKAEIGMPSSVRSSK